MEGGGVLRTQLGRRGLPVSVWWHALLDGRVDNERGEAECMGHMTHHIATGNPLPPQPRDSHVLLTAIQRLTTAESELLYNSSRGSVTGPNKFSSICASLLFWLLIMYSYCTPPPSSGCASLLFHSTMQLHSPLIRVRGRVRESRQ